MASKKKTTAAKAARKKTDTLAVKPGKALPPTAHGNKPIYMLVIMALVTALIILYNNKEIVHKTETRTKTQKKVSDVKVKRSSNDKEKIVIIDESGKDSDATLGDKKQTIEKGVQLRTVKLYFIKINSHNEKMLLTTVVRTVNSDAILLNTLKKLVQGPSAAEKHKGIYTAIPTQLQIRKVKIANQTAIIDFNGAIEWGATGSILLSRIDQVVYTATQFEDVKNVVIMINGKRKQTLGSDGISIGGPLYRR